MGLDVRLPLGLLFTIIGALLAVFGAFSDKSIYAPSLGINVNLWWGLVMVVAGMTCLWLCSRHTTPATERETARATESLTVNDNA